MEQIKKIKKALKVNKLWRNYKHKFSNHQMCLIFSKVALVFYPNISWEFLYQNEVVLLYAPKNKEIFLTSFENLKKFTKNNYDWKSFGFFLWYIYQISTFYIDKKHRQENIYKVNTHIEVNSQKREYYHLWLNSIDPKLPSFNQKISKVLKLVL